MFVVRWHKVAPRLTCDPDDLVRWSSKRSAYQPAALKALIPLVGSVRKDAACACSSPFVSTNYEFSITISRLCMHVSEEDIAKALEWFEDTCIPLPLLQMCLVVCLAELRGCACQG